MYLNYYFGIDKRVVNDSLSVRFYVLIRKKVYRRRYESHRSSNPNCITKTKKNKIWRKTIFNMADEIITSCNVARSWHWFARWLQPAIWHVALESWQWIHQVVAPCKWYVAVGWHAVELARWQHPAMWHITVGSKHWIRQVAAPCNVAGGSGMTCHKIRPNVRRIRILHL